MGRGSSRKPCSTRTDHLNGVLFIDHLKSLLDLKKIPPEMLDWTEEEEEAEAA